MTNGRGDDAESNRSELAKLKSQRSNLKRKTTNLETFLSTATADDYDEVLFRYNVVQPIWEQFEAIHADIVSIDSAKEAEHETYCDEFVTKFYNVTAKARKFLKDNKSDETEEVNNTVIQNDVEPNASNVRLPRIDLPTFNGKYEAWTCFYDTFKSMVHEKTHIAKIEKFYYLRSCLKEEAATVVQSLETTEANYEIAWSLLKDRYDNKRVIVHNHLKHLFELPVSAKENPVSLRQMLDTINTHTRALKSLGQAVDSWDSVIIYHMTNKLDRITHQEWEKSNKGSDLPTLKSFIEFLKTRCQILEATQVQFQSNANVINPKASSSTHKKHVMNITTNKDYCHFCKGEHKMYTCDKFMDLAQKERYEFVKNERLCFNCLRKNHVTEKCTCRPCKKCNRKHHTVLHFERPATDDTTSNTASNTAQKVHHVNCPAQVLLATAKIHFYDKHNNKQTARVLLDSGAQAHFVTERFAKLLKLPHNKINVPVSTLNNAQTNIAHGISAKIASRLGNYEKDLSLLVVPSITGALPSHSINVNELNIPQNLPLADPTFFESSEVDALLGAEVYFNIDCAGKIPIANTDAVLLKTKLGWVVGGSISPPEKPVKVACNHSIAAASKDISRFWELEEIPEVKFLSQEEAEIEKHFLKHFRRDNDGRCIVKIPFNSKIGKLENNYPIALKQFYRIERKLNKDPVLKQQYCDFMSEYEALGHMSLSTRETCENYIPHHEIFKEGKIRVVFNASSMTNSLSLNQTQMVGPVLQDDIFSILTRARFHQILLVADITKMYRQVLVEQKDRKYQKILWRANPDEPIKIYDLNTLTYGTAAASYLAIRSVRQVAEQEKQNYPIAAEIVKRDFYVDDLMTGADTIEKALIIRDQMNNLLKTAGLELRKWSSNDYRVTDTLPAELTNVKLFDEPGSSIKALGIRWNPEHDHLSYEVNSNDTIKKRATKRNVLSRIAQFFDPIGLLGPVIVQAKLIMQTIWRNELDWDASLPLDIHTEWLEYQKQLPLLNDLSFDRCVLIDEPVNIQLHGFCDSSDKAYGACIYIRSTNKNNECVVRLLCAKSKVAPLKSKLTTPKQELCSALLLANLYKSVVSNLPIKIDSVHFWSDSTITLHWINTQPSLLKTFVANRVSEIRAITHPSQWKHVSSGDNPADYISRGQCAQAFLLNDVWKYGPAWLRADEQEWPNLPLKSEPLPETRPTIVLAARAQDSFELPKASSFTKLIRIVAYCHRFINKLKRKPANADWLTADDLNAAERSVLRVVQRQSFEQERNNLVKNEQISNKSSLKTLNPFIDANDLIRVGGRLEKSQLNYDEKHPIVLPKSNWITDLIIKRAHVISMHSGAQATLCQVRSQYWPIDGKNITRRVIHSCVKCSRFKQDRSHHLMGDLPENRVTQARPFLNAGVDYCGPFYIKEKKLRNRNKVKAYIAIFVCFSSKAVHLEVVSDLTADAFIACLKRFFARRGKSKNVYSDNGTNFVGANNEIQELYKFFRDNANNKAIFEALANESINWHFIPPKSPHFGGLWESAVKSFKAHFLRTVGNTLLTFEELNTHAIEIEAVLNSRPLTPLSTDPNDLTVLTPGHFLIGDRLLSIPDYDFTCTPSNRLSSWQRLQQLKQHFWRRWHKEYLNQLNVRSKWTSHNAPDIKVGSMVLLKEDNVPPLQWCIGRIVEIHPGDDDIVRVVTVKTINGTYKRAINKIALLPVDV